MEQGPYKFFEKSPIYEADVKLLYNKIWAKSNVQSNRSPKNAHFKMDYQKIAKTCVKKRRDALG